MIIAVVPLYAKEEATPTPEPAGLDGVVFTIENKKIVPGNVSTTEGNISITFLNMGKKGKTIALLEEESEKVFFEYENLVPKAHIGVTILLPGGNYEVITRENGKITSKASLEVISKNYSQEKTDTLSVGDKAPDFSLESNFGEFNLATQKGTIVLAFLPGAFTEVCTRQISDYQDEIRNWRRVNATIAAISADSIAVMKAWGKQLDIKDIYLISDFQREVLASYGVLSEDGNARRTIIIIDKSDKIRNIYTYPDSVLPRSYDLLKILKSVR